MIKKAVLSELSEIKKLTEACAEALQKNNIFQWNEFYPSKEKLQHDILEEELYVLKEDGKIVGIIVLTPKVDDEYLPVQWLTPSEKNLYVHRLAVHPEHWREGKGKQLMNFAEKFALTQGYSSIRLDTFSRNIRNQKFYENRGYHRLEEIYFPRQSEYPFYCYEKILF